MESYSGLDPTHLEALAPRLSDSRASDGVRSLVMPLLYILAMLPACRGCEQPDNEIGRVMAMKQDCLTGLARCVAS